MSPKIKERFINFMINLVTAGAMLLVFLLSRRDTVNATVTQEIDSKASVEYVDKQDEEIKETMKEDKIDHQKQHTATNNLLESMDSKIDILLTKE